MAEVVTVDMASAATRFERVVGQCIRKVRTGGARVVQKHTGTVRKLVIATSPVDTRALQRSWGTVMTGGDEDHPWASVANSAPYAPILEYGGYRGVGPRTVRLGGGDLGAGFQAGAGIYSRQAPLGWVRKALARTGASYRAAIWNVVHTAWPYESSGAAGEALGESSDLGALFGVDIISTGTSPGLSANARTLVRETLRDLRRRRR